MFSFFKHTPALTDLIPNDYVDIHSHLLFAIDDGAKTPEDSISLVTSLADMGFTQFITTPHVMHTVWDNSQEKITARLSETAAILSQNNIGIPLRAAAEYMMDSFFVQRLKTEKLLTLKDNHVLVEMSYVNPPIHLYEILFDLQVAGYTPVLAHPERYSFYHRNFGEYAKLKHAGCLFQINLLSIVGYYGEGVQKTAERLLREGLIDFTGSDVHHSKHIDAFSRKLNLKDVKPLADALQNNSFFRY
ncbi:MAG: histidinol phosphatase [Flavobacterium sp.]|uniref:tyrosine-protein phosphatase n=1 Tax=Flavobacterium sp. TaxID=239 RepID=UPI0011F472F6|nr:CpsB/CapC family capsule biosynthesis tyrosine phosphatase [Flavobacterium sp.]RZJ66071.1 MAG: histidinol phosphatase [Flavobacterium sp.]